MEQPDILKRDIKVLTFDQYGTVVDMQKDLTEKVTSFLKDKGWEGEACHLLHGRLGRAGLRQADGMYPSLPS